MSLLCAVLKDVQHNLDLGEILSEMVLQGSLLSRQLLYKTGCGEPEQAKFKMKIILPPFFFLYFYLFIYFIFGKVTRTVSEPQEQMPEGKSFVI